MHIKKISIKNFKSFGKKVDIPLDKGFTVISGPNGSGKSNIIDSIVFCLGLHTSSKILRAEKLPDLIYSGNGRKVGTAEVEIVFENSGEELRIARRVKITERNYYSYYYINGKPASHGEVMKILEKEGIYSDAYNIVMQGDVTRIVEMTPFQRRKIIDDIAGISEFEEKKARAIEELEAVRQNIEKISAILSEVEQRLKNLEKDKVEALRYKDLIARKERLELELMAIKRKELEQKLSRISREIERLEKSKDKAITRISEIIKVKENLREEMEEISKKISEEADERYRELQALIADYQAEVEGLRREEEFARNQIESLNQEKMRTLLELDRLSDEVESLRKDLSDLILQRESVLENENAVKSRMDDLMRKIEEISGEEREIRDRILGISEKIENLNSAKGNLLRERDRVYEGLRRITIEIEDIDGQISRIRNEYGKIKDQIEAKTREKEEYEDRLAKLISKKKEADNSIFSLRNELSSIDEEIRQKELELAKVKAEISAYEARYNKAVELILEARERKALPGIFGVVAQLAEVDEKYALALEIAAGSALNFIVVENEDDAVRAINYLKQIKGGRATFLPLNKIRKNFEKMSLDKSLIGEKGVVDYAVNLVKCDARFRPVFNFVYRDTVVVDNVENAKRIMDGRRIVTLDGELIEKSGAITGGSVDRKTGLLLTKELVEKEKRISEEISVLNSKKAYIVGELRKIEDHWRGIQGEIESVEELVRGCERELEMLRVKMESASTMEKELIEKAEMKDAERRSLAQKIEEVEVKLKEISKEIESLSKELEALNRKVKGSELPKLSKELESLKNQHSVIREGLIKIESEIEKKELEIKQKESLINERENRVEDIGQKTSELSLRITESREKVEKLNLEIEKLRGEEDRLGEKVKELREKRDEIFARMRELENEQNRLEYDITGYDERIGARREVIEQIRKEIDELPELEPEINREKAVSELEKVEAELSGFGDVNLKAIQEYDEVKTRWEELFTRKTELEREREEIIERIEKYDKMKREKFFEVFNALNENFREIIRSLANGEGELYLDNPDDPFNSGLYMRVRPYGRQVQKLEQMSGGEKSLVALALIFAIQRYKPAPFYAFDEVDMFLDGVNVAMLARMIKELSSHAQFIVVSLRKPMLEEADAIVGVTMGRDNISQVTGIRKASMIQ